MDFYTSDWHLGHNKDFIYEARGFETIEDHDEAIFRNLHDMLSCDDTLYMLGDVVFSNYDEYLERIKGLLFRKILVVGNHEHNNKLSKIKKYNVFDEVVYGHGFVYNKDQYMLTHIPLILGEHNLERAHKIINIHGHTHSVEKSDSQGHINVAVDAWDMKPVSFKEILELVPGKEKAE